MMMRILMKSAAFLALLAISSVAAARAEDKSPSGPAAAKTKEAAQPIDYARQIEPLLRKYCAACHNDEDREGGLSVASHAALLKGGEHGAVVTPGEGDQSRLVRVITGRAEPRMPPRGSEAPSADETQLLAAWIKAGARGPTGEAPDPTAFVTPKIPLRAAARETLHAVAISPDGALVAIARHGAVKLLDAATSGRLALLTGCTGSVNSVAFSADGQYLAAAAGEPNVVGEARVWKLSDRSLAATLRGHRDSLLAVRFSPDGRTLATAGYDQKIKQWDWAAQRELRTLDGHNGPVFDLAIRADGRVLASASGDRTIKLWDWASGARLETLKEPLQEQYTVAFSPDGQRVAAGGVDNRIRVWSVSESAQEGTNRLLISQFAHESPLLRLAFSADGRTLASTSEDRLVKVWNGQTLTPRATLAAQPDWPVGLALHPSQPRAIVGCIDGSLSWLDYPLSSTSEERPLAPLAETPPDVDYGPQPPLDQLPRTPESEPNDAPRDATRMAIPGVATGKIQAPRASASDVDLFRITAKAGEQWMIETNAARGGSPLDSKIQVLDAQGLPVPRLLLRAVRDSEIEFRSMDSSARGVRLKNWEEMLLNEYIYLNGEVIKHYQQRRGPDADSNFYPESGPRFAFFDTTSRAHALGQPAYVVVPYPLGTPLPNNGLPVFTVNYENDDESQRKLGKDSRLHFVAPADGEYLVRVEDVRGFAGDKFTYELAVRRPSPSFTVTLGGVNPKVAAGSGKSFSVKAERLDNFMGPIRIDIAGLPAGYHVSTPLVIEAGLYEARGVIYVDPDAPPLAAPGVGGTKATATALIAGRETTKDANDLGTISALPQPKVLVHLGPEPQAAVAAETGPGGYPVVTIVPGQRAACRLKIDRHGLTDRVSFEVENLPHGVIVDDIGLNGVLLPEGQTERTLFLSCEPWVPATERLFHAVAKVDGDQASRPVWLRVVRPSTK
ncbi:MAG: c-type cytochrome domain-containing protein [Pirellulales bacterium]